MPELPENQAELLAALLKGEPQAMRLLVDTYKNRVYNTVLGIVQNAEDAEELAQDIFVKAIQTITKFKGDAQLGTWLYRIAVNTALDHLKMKKRKKRFAFLVSLNNDEENRPDPPDFVHPGLQLENKELAQTLFKAMDALAENQKTAWVLNKIEGLSYEQTAQVMQTTVSSVESLLFRAKQNLKKLMGNYLEKDK